MTRQQFDSTLWRKGMRCRAEVQNRNKETIATIHGTIVGVHFGGYFCKVRWDGKDLLSKYPCERLTLED